ncbi:hypothetical protein BS47DRAFT_1304959 [Hydnum rufescens UP504]|uniref:Uncharacterized protein n=1 Tax=Hydnum rufescens UP504 TaxID=1448309 RepID=A0A9P6DPW2_9AGAM|nr:hypothetical protein BS47DRAFT_1304959 [Hydnum rufescens UP504]
MAPSIAGSSNFGSSAGHEIGRPYKFRSPLFKMGHAPLLRVFVPSPEGQWLSDENVIQCEEELQLAGITSLLKVGDVVWDIAVGDEGNLGRMVWDGTYLIDLDYSYSLTGEIPPYIDSMCFPPSYWHKIIRVAGNPICHVDIRPYAKEIAANIGLLQSRVQTETPQGHHHTVIRWIHKSRFQVRGDTPLLPAKPGPGRTQLIDPAWDGTVYIEAEGTDEGLQDLQARCGNTISLVSDTSRAAITGATRTAKGKSVFRMIRGNSRPGELWLRCVREKERILN